MAETIVHADRDGVSLRSMTSSLTWFWENRILALRWVLVLCQATTIAITWSLWDVRARPPLLPMMSIPQIPVGIILLGTLALTLWLPRAGVLSHWVVLLYAFAADQTRIQPEIVSLALLLVGTTTLPLGAAIARAHLVSLWIWSGINKAMSLDFMEESAPWIFDGLPIRLALLRPSFGWIILGSEMLIGICLLVRPLRRAGVVLAFAVHGTILLVLLGRRWNPSVWPWNIALPAAAAVLFWPREERAREPRRPRGVVFAVLLLMPIGFYGGVVDTYLAHNLYASNTATAVVCPGSGACSGALFLETWSALRVPLPPEPRVFTAYFRAVCRPGERLVVRPRRVRMRWGKDAGTLERTCTR